MASLPSPTQVSGKHNAIYEAYFKQVDPKGLGTIEAMDAAKFLKKSGLSDVVLSRIWDLSDPKGRGCLDKVGFFVSLKLVALAQAGLETSMRNIYTEPPNPPKVGEIPKIPPQTIQSVPPTNADWTMKPADKLKYEQLYNSLQPVNGLIAGNKVKGVLMDSKLPVETLGKIWDLADQDKDGNLDLHEFTVALHLVYQALDKRAIPSFLPPELQKKINPVPPPVKDSFGDGGFVANFPKDIAPPPVPPLPAVMSSISRVPPPIPSMPLISSDPISSSTVLQSATAVDWVVTPQERIRFEGIFRDSDRDKDGLVSGLEVKNVFLQSGVPQNCLAHIWALCDTNQSGKLTCEQFALAMWMVERKKNGIEPPEVLTPNMVPPSLRGSTGVEIPVAQPETKPTYSNPELEMISKEIEQLSRERRILETDIAQKEADIRIKTGEVRSLQSELDTLAATLKQLENQKGEAQKRLDDLKAQVNKIRDQCQKQEATINEQEGELNSKRSELQKLKDEENALEKEYDSNRKELDNLTRQLQDTQLQISQVKAMVTQLLETQRQMNDALLLCKAAIEANDAVLVSDYSLKIEPDFREAKKTFQKQQFEQQNKNDDDFINGGGDEKNFNNNTNEFTTTDQFNNNNNNNNNNTNGIMKTTFDDSFANAPLSGFDDAFTSGFSNHQSSTKDPFTSSSGHIDPFGGSGGGGDKKIHAVTPEPGKDDFGSDPFAILHAPTGAGQVLSPNTQKSGPPPRPESPSPALPPKKAKQPPPRPAPPRPLQGPARPAPPSTDGFGSSGGFADFADFDNKPPSLSPSPIPSSIPIVRETNQTKVGAVAAASASVGTDFSEDPFKDYRYEDPFNISDPFADEEKSEDNLEEDFSDDPKIQKNLKTLSSDDFLNNIKLDKSITDFHKNTDRITNINKISNDFADFDAFTTTSSFSSSSTDFFDAFNDNFKNTNKNLNEMKFDAFGDNNKTTKSTKLFDNFEDEFAKMNLKDNNNKTIEDNFAKFDTFDDDDFTNSKNSRTTSNNDNNNNIRNNSNKENKNYIASKFLEDYSKTDNFDEDLQKALQKSLTEK